MFTVEELMEMFVDEDSQRVILYGVNAEKNIFEGYYNDMPDRYHELEITSIDNINETENITFNVED